MQLTINETVATAVNSSMSEDCFRCKTLSDVNTKKQSPKRLDEVFKMWDDLFMVMGLTLFS